MFAYNLAHGEDGGALLLSNGLLHIDTDASVSFSHNSAGGSSNGGAICINKGEMTIKTNATVNLSNNLAQVKRRSHLLV